MSDSDSTTSETRLRPELVVAIVSPLGTSVDPVVSDLKSAFSTVGYTTRSVRVSQLLARAEYERTGKSGPAGKRSRPRWLMDLGDELRRKTGLEAAAAHLAIAKVQKQREDQLGPRTNQQSYERSGVVTILRSLKRLEEVELLRSVYGPRLLVLGVSASSEMRHEALVDRLVDDHPGRKPSWYEKEASRLLVRDEVDDDDPMGQRLRSAFSMCDAYVWLRPGHDSSVDITRLVRAWFGHPFTTPTRDEQAMFIATAAKYRSAAAGRQVGAAVIDADGEVLVTGMNDVPKPHGGQYWESDDPDFRDFRLDVEMNDKLKYQLAVDVISRLKKKWLRKKLRDKDVADLTQKALTKGGALAGSQIRDLIEFGRILHAEMAAICTAARRGTALRGGEMYTTTYPCHECARLIIGSGISRVVYIDPYPKSQVPVMFAHQISNGTATTSSPDVIPFDPFEGVAPILFDRVFTMNKRSRDTKGAFEPWVPKSLAERFKVPELALEDGALREFVRRYVPPSPPNADAIDVQGGLDEPDAAAAPADDGTPLVPGAPAGAGGPNGGVRSSDDPRGTAGGQVDPPAEPQPHVGDEPSDPGATGAGPSATGAAGDTADPAAPA